MAKSNFCHPKRPPRLIDLQKTNCTLPWSLQVVIHYNKEEEGPHDYTFSMRRRSTDGEVAGLVSPAEVAQGSNDSPPDSIFLY